MAPPQRNAAPEGTLQERVVKWFRYQALPLKARLWASQEGMWMADTKPGEARSKAQIGRIARAIQVAVNRGMVRGTPDTTWAWPEHGSIHDLRLPALPAGWGLIEVKAEGSTYSDLDDDQRGVILGLLDAGVRVAIAQSMYDVQDVLRGPITDPERPWRDVTGWGVHLRQFLAEEARPVPHPRRQKWPLEGEELRTMILTTTKREVLWEYGYEPPKLRRGPPQQR